MEMQPKVSILIPIYNVEFYLSKCLDSIIHQTYKDLQIVLIDDGSNDHSFDICQEYALKDKRIEIFHQENQGVANTRNHLLEKVKGYYVLFVDSDDWIETDMIEHLVTLSESNNADIVMCDKLINDTKPSSKGQIVVQLNKKQAIKDFLHHNYFVGSLWNKLFKTSLLINIRFPHDISYGEDALFCWEVLKRTNNIIVTNKELYHYRKSNTGLSHSYNGHHFSAYKVWKHIVDDISEYFPEYLPLAQAQFCNQMTVILYNAAKNGYKEDSHTNQLCQIISQYKLQMKKYGCSIKKFYFASLLCKHYSLVRIMLQ